MGKRRPSGDGMVRKRDDGRWEGRIVVGHKANGDPIFRHVYAKTQKALTEKLHQSIECYQDVELTEDSRMTLSEWLDRWLTEYKDGTIRPGTLENYRNYIENYIKPQLGGKQDSICTFCRTSCACLRRAVCWFRITCCRKAISSNPAMRCADAIGRFMRGCGNIYTP